MPHTRPIQVTGSAHDEETAARLGLARSRYEGPTGISGVFQDACVQAGIPSLSFWASVPHYVSQAPSPKATLALLHRVEEILDIEVPLGTLPAQADEWEAEVSQIAAEDEEISEYIRALEEREEEDEPLKPASGESIAAEFERYLRRRGPRPGEGRRPSYDEPGMGTGRDRLCRPASRLGSLVGGRAGLGYWDQDTDEVEIRPTEDRLPGLIFGTVPEAQDDQEPAAPGLPARRPATPRSTGCWVSAPRGSTSGRPTVRGWCWPTRRATSSAS